MMYFMRLKDESMVLELFHFKPTTRVSWEHDVLIY